MEAQAPATPRGPAASTTSGQCSTTPGSDLGGRNNERSTTIRIFQLNVRSLRKKKKRNYLEALIEFENYDVICLGETWLSEAFTNGMITPENYNLAVRTDRDSLGGGTAILIKKGIKFYAPKSVNIDDYAQISSVMIKNIRIACIYRKPENIHEVQDNKIKSYLTNDLKGDNIIICGDLNLRGTNWLHGIYPTRPAKVWHDIVATMGLQQIITTPTHNQGNQLDCFFYKSSSNLVLSDPVIEDDLYYKVTDHFGIYVDVNIFLNRERKKKEIINMKSMNWQNFKEKTKEKKVIPKIARSDNESGKWTIIKSAFISARDDSCQKITIKENNTPRWIGPSLQKSLRKSQKLRLLSQKPSNSKVKRERTQKYIVHRRILKSNISKARVAFEMKEIEKLKSDPKVLFNMVKRAKSSFSSPQISDINGKVLITDKEKADAFNEKFMNVYTPLSNHTFHWVDNWGLNNIAFTPAKIKHAIKKMNPNASPGYDEINAKFYKECDLSIIFALADLYDHSIQNTVLPEDFLVSKSIPLWKNKGSVGDIKTYRNITMGNTGIKVMESVMISDIDDHITQHQLSDPCQHGFQPGRSTITNLIETWEIISKDIDRGGCWASCSLDFSNAFDTISINHLLLALWDIGIGGKLAAFIEYWLKSRKQYVQVGESKSEISTCSSGTPQGSIGGPRFFSILLAYAFKGLEAEGQDIEVKISCFADDTRILFKSRNLAESVKAQRFLNNLNSRINEVILSLNASKSVMMYFGKGNYQAEYTIDGEVIPIKDESIELGCMLSTTMSFKPQLDRNMKKSSAFVFLIRNTLQVRNYKAMKILYQTYFLSILCYASQVWFGDYEYIKLSLYKMYRLFWRLGYGYIKPGVEIFDPYQFVIKNSLVFLHQMRLGKVNMDFDTYFKIKTNQLTRSDRISELIVQSNKTVRRDSFFTTCMAKWYNKLDLSVREEKSIGVFKTKAAKFVKDEIPTPTWFDFRPWRKRYQV